MLEAVCQTSDPKLNTQIQPGQQTDKYTRDASVDKQSVSMKNNELGHDYFQI